MKEVAKILLLAITLEGIKHSFLILVLDHLLSSNEFFNAIIVISALVLSLPEMLVSYEQGPHGLGAKIIMFSSGTVVNVVLILIASALWQSRKRKQATAH